MNEQTDFIEIYDEIITKKLCLEFIDFFKQLKKINLTFTRQALNDDLPHNKSDETAFLLEKDVLDLPVGKAIVETFFPFLGKCYQSYVNKYSVLSLASSHGVTSVRIQKILPGEGYHAWHFETTAAHQQNRILAWMAYLNDVEEGGETEFLYLRKRIKPKQGRIIIWPAGFTHTHRGNPPLSGEKYILTGWIEYTPK